MSLSPEEAFCSESVAQDTRWLLPSEEEVQFGGQWHGEGLSKFMYGVSARNLSMGASSGTSLIPDD